MNKSKQYRALSFNLQATTEDIRNLFQPVISLAVCVTPLLVFCLCLIYSIVFSANPVKPLEKCKEVPHQPTFQINKVLDSLKRIYS